MGTAPLFLDGKLQVQIEGKLQVQIEQIL